MVFGNPGASARAGAAHGSCTRTTGLEAQAAAVTSMPRRTHRAGGGDRTRDAGTARRSVATTLHLLGGVESHTCRSPRAVGKRFPRVRSDRGSGGNRTHVARFKRPVQNQHLLPTRSSSHPLESNQDLSSFSRARRPHAQEWVIRVPAPCGHPRRSSLRFSGSGAPRRVASSRPPAGLRRFGGAAVLGPGFEPGSERFRAVRRAELDQPSMSVVIACLVGRPGIEPGELTRLFYKQPRLHSGLPPRICVVVRRRAEEAEMRKGPPGASPRWPFVEHRVHSRVLQESLLDRILATAGEGCAFDEDLVTPRGVRWTDRDQAAAEEPIGGASLHGHGASAGLRRRQVM